MQVNDQEMKAMREQSERRRTEALASGSSSATLLERIRELERECEEILQTLIDHGQIVAAHKMDDAVTGLHKTRSCWNKDIKW